MNFSLTIETDRISCSNVDLDGNTNLLPIDDYSEFSKTHLSTNVMINGNHVFLGDVVETMKLELTNIPVAMRILCESKMQSGDYIDDLDRKWSYTELLALLFSKIKSQIESNGEQSPDAFTLCVSENLKQQQYSGIKQALLYNNMSFVKPITHTQSLAYYLFNELEKQSHLNDEVNVLCFNADMQGMKFSSFKISKRKIELLDKGTKVHAGLEIVLDGVKKVIVKEFEKTQQQEFKLHRQSQPLLDEYARNIYRHIFQLNKKTFDKSFIINNKLIKVSICKEDVQNEIDQVLSNFENGLNAVLTNSQWDKKSIDYLVMVGSQGNIGLFREFLESHYPDFNAKIKFSIRNDILARGAALGAYYEQDEVSVKGFENELIDSEKCDTIPSETEMGKSAFTKRLNGVAINGKA